jgi:peptide/nickel transport system substrate-binding protein
MRLKIGSKLVSLALAAAGLGVGLVAATSSASTAASTPTPTPTTVTWAEVPGTAPDYIFPFMSLAFFSVSNINQFQDLMFRPLYWFGRGATPELNPSLSMAETPVYSNNGQTVTVTLKGYRWSNGEAVDATDVLFWMNMLHAERANWAAYTPGGLSIPDDVTSITIDSPAQLTFQLTQPFNHHWFTDNQLSQITPLPVAWDITSVGAVAGSGGCSSAAYGTADAACAAVYTFLSNQAGYDPSNPKAANDVLSTYATNPLWQVVDGPWHLTHFDAEGNVTFKPNPSYSGPVKPTIKSFTELPFPSETAEFNALVGGKVNVGYLPTPDITASTSNPLEAGPNNPRLGDFTIAPLYTWSINYLPYNFDSTGDNGAAGKIFSQLYFRQAMQYLVDQPLYIQQLSDGYGVGTYGPVPIVPANPFASALEKANPYRYNPGKAKSLLTSHGWKIVPNGTSTCQRAGVGPTHCGAGIPVGVKLAFTLQYASGVTLTANTMNAEQSSWASVGINVSLSSASFGAVIGNATPCPAGCSWELENSGVGWLFAPDYYPSGEEIFSTGAGSNSGNYSDPINDRNAEATDVSSVNLTTYENYLAKQLPVIFQPNYVTSLTEIQHGLSGITPQNVFGQLNPENWRWTK